MNAQPKYEIGSTNNRLYATELLGRKKKSNFDGLGEELLGLVGILVILFAVVGVIFGKVAGISVTVAIGILFGFTIATCHMPETVDLKAMRGHDFYQQHADSVFPAWEMQKILDEALAHDDYRIDAEAIIHAGIAGFNTAVDADGRIQVSSVLEEAAAKLQQKMQEHRNVHNTTAEDVTRNYLEGFR